MILSEMSRAYILYVVPRCFMYNNVVSQSSQNSQENELCTEILYPKNLLAEFREEYGHAFTKLRYTDYL